MTRQISPIAKLKWPAWLALLLIFAACATSAPPGNLSSVQRDSQSTPLHRQASEIAEASSPIGEPPAATNFTTPVNVPATTDLAPSPQVPPTETISDSPKLAVQKLIAEATAVLVVSTTAPVPTVNPAIAPTSTTLATPPAVTPVPVAVVPPVVRLPTSTSLPPPTLGLQQNTAAKPGKEQSAEEATPVPTAAVVSIEPTKTPISDPTPTTVSPPAAAVDTDAAAGSARSFVLPSAQGQQVYLDDYLERGNVVLIFYRAFW